MGSISSITNNANDTMTITSTIVPGTMLSNGESVAVYVPQGDTTARPGQGNTTYQVSNVTTNANTCSFTINVAGNGAYTSDGLWMLSTDSSASTSPSSRLTIGCRPTNRPTRSGHRPRLFPPAPVA